MNPGNYLRGALRIAAHGRDQAQQIFSGGLIDVQFGGLRHHFHHHVSAGIGEVQARFVAVVMAVEETVGSGSPKQPLHRPIDGAGGEIRGAKAVGGRAGRSVSARIDVDTEKRDGGQRGRDPQDGEQRAAFFGGGPSMTGASRFYQR